MFLGHRIDSLFTTHGDVREKNDFYIFLLSDLDL